MDLIIIFIEQKLQLYDSFRLWDTYAAEHATLNVVTPMQNADMVKSNNSHRQQGVQKLLPFWSLMGNENWCMSGYHAVYCFG